MSRAIAIINPSSAKGRARRAWPEISATLHDAGLSFDEVTTHSPQEGMERAALAGGVGFDAEVAHLVNRWPRWIRGTTVYVLGILQTLITYRPVDAHITVDGKEQRLKLFLLAAANTNWYGGGMYMAPHASIEDGLLA